MGNLRPVSPVMSIKMTAAAMMHRVMAAAARTTNATVNTRFNQFCIISLYAQHVGDFMSKREVDFVSPDDKLQKKISSDQELNALKKMRDLQTDQESKLEIQDFIDKRIAEICHDVEEV